MYWSYSLGVKSILLLKYENKNHDPLKYHTATLRIRIYIKLYYFTIIYWMS